MIKWYTDRVFPWLMKKNIGKKSIIFFRAWKIKKQRDCSNTRVTQFVE